ncbi:MAG: polysaccharide biosynthesis C-terminal domain-containing protein [Planctomyces sp.]|nr:polysaccharide biosynthesis C-terminal domain-containing protein [Planctomyces sp.]
MQRTTVKPVLVVTAGSLAQMALQLAMQTLIARRFGTATEVDAYDAAISLPIVLSAVLGLPIGSVLIPIVSRAEQDHGSAGAWSAATRIGLLAVVSTALAAAILIAFAPGIVDLLFPGIASPATPGLLRTLAWLVPANVLTAYCQAVHNWQGRFAWPALAGVAGPAATLAMIAAAGPAISIDRVAVAAVIGAAVNVVIQFAPLLGRLSFRGGQGASMAALRLLFPLLASNLYLRMDPVVDRALGSGFDPGTVACLGYSARVMTAALAVAVGGLSVVAFPRMARAAQQGDAELSREVSDSLRALLTILVPLAAALWFFSADLIRDLFERGRFLPEDTARVADFVRCSLGILIGGSLGEMTARAFYARHDTRTPVVVGSLFFVLALALKFLLSGWLGPRGILIASSISMTACAGVQLLLLSRRIGRESASGVARRLATTATAAAAGGLSGWGVLQLHPPLASVLAGVIGFAVYAGVLTALIRWQRPAALQAAGRLDAGSGESE